MIRKPKLTVTAALAAQALILSACAAGGSDSSSESSGVGGSLTFVAWGGGMQEATEEIIVRPWGEENGVEVLSDGPTDYAKVQAQVESGNVQWDVVTAEQWWAVSSCGKLLEPIKSDVDTTDLLEDATSECGIPFDVYAFVLVYNTEMFGDNPPTSWADFFDTRAFPGKRGIMNYAAGGGLEVALLGDGVARDDLYPMDLDRAFNKLDSIRDDIAFYDTLDQSVQQMESGEVAMSLALSGRTLEAVKNGAPYEAVWQDHIMSADVLVVPKGSSNKESAISLISHATTPEAQSAIMAEYTYGTVNEKAEPDLDDLEKSFSPTENGEFDKGRFLDQDWWGENYGTVSEQWTTWTSS